MKLHKTKLDIPKWAANLYLTLAVILVPWTIYLAYSLPRFNLSRHYDLSWVGFDIGIMVSLLITGLLARLKSRSVSLAATTTATLLIVDAWFDISSSRAGWQLDQAILLAVFVELPLAIISFAVAIHSIRSLSK